MRRACAPCPTLAEMDLQNRQVLRLLGYRLQQAGEPALAVPIFERVLELAPNEPQSHRDLGLALAPDRPGAARHRAALRSGHRALGRPLRRHRPDRAERAERRRGQGGTRCEAASTPRRSTCPAAEEHAARCPGGAGLGRRRHRRRPARHRPERRGGVLWPQPVLPGRHDQPRRDRRLRSGGVLRCATPSLGKYRIEANFFKATASRC